MIKADVVRGKVGKASGWLSEADAILSRPPEEFLADIKRRDLAAFYLFLTIQECTNLAAYWIADAGWGLPEDALFVFDTLVDYGAIDRDLAEKMRGAVGLRNRIAYGYARIDHARLQNEFPERVGGLRSFLELVSREAGL
jgi:uncharacterized protein YutE (UPF0331/DUF86 family)